jgi:hypothetical protein
MAAAALSNSTSGSGIQLGDTIRVKTIIIG